MYSSDKSRVGFDTVDTIRYDIAIDFSITSISKGLIDIERCIVGMANTGH
jgi:hypothetical protein